MEVDELKELLYEEICKGVDEANEIIKEDGARAGYPYEIEVICQNS